MYFKFDETYRLYIKFYYGAKLYNTFSLESLHVLSDNNICSLFEHCKNKSVCKKMLEKVYVLNSHLFICVASFINLKLNYQK